MEKIIDLQCHTTASDGKLSPKELVELAIAKGLFAIAITDHDTVDGIEEAVIASKNKPLEVISGVEISCDDDGFIDTHILGLFINLKDRALNLLLDNAKLYRDSQKKEIILKFKKLGFKISYNEVKSLAKGEVGRPHIAQVIFKNNRDKVKSVEDVFDKYLAVGKMAYAERKNKISVNRAIDAIHSAGGLAFVAHPGVYKNFNPEKFIKYFIGCGGDGIETFYDYSQSRFKITKKENGKLIKKFSLMAQKLNALQTGGSDFHGKQGQELGKLKVPYVVLENLKKHLRKKWNL